MYMTKNKESQPAAARAETCAGTYLYRSKLLPVLTVALLAALFLAAFPAAVSAEGSAGADYGGGQWFCR